MPEYELLDNMIEAGLRIELKLRYKTGETMCSINGNIASYGDNALEAIEKAHKQYSTQSGTIRKQYHGEGVA